MDLSTCAIGLGAISAAYGISRPNSRRTTMLLVAASVALIAFTSISGAASQELCQKYLQDLPKSKELIKLVREAGYLKCENFLPWKESIGFPHQEGYQPGFSTIGVANDIRPEDMSQSVMWTVSPQNGFVVAIRHICNDGPIGAIAFVQRMRDKAQIAAEGFFQSDQIHCRFPVPMYENHPGKAFEYLKEVLKKGFVLIEDKYNLSDGSSGMREIVTGIGNFSIV